MLLCIALFHSYKLSSVPYSKMNLNSNRYTNQKSDKKNGQ